MCFRHPIPHLFQPIEDFLAANTSANAMPFSSKQGKNRLIGHIYLLIDLEGIHVIAILRLIPLI